MTLSFKKCGGSSTITSVDITVVSSYVNNALSIVYYY